MPLTRAEEQLVRESFDSVRYAALPLAKLFYGRLFSLDPAIKPLFTHDLTEQARKLISMLDTTVASLSEFDGLRPRLRQLGSDHAGYGVRDTHYDTLSQALLWALGQALEQQFDAPTKKAWATLIAEISAEMRRGAAGA